MYLVNLNLSYKNLLLSPKDFLTLSELMQRATVVDSRWLNKGPVNLVVDDNPTRISAELFTGKTISEDEWKKLKEAENENAV